MGSRATTPPTSAERRLGLVLRILAGLLLLAAVGYIAGALVVSWQEFFREAPFVANSAVKVTIIAIACVYAAGDLRRRRPLVGIVIAAHVISLLAMASMLLFADTARDADLGFATPSMTVVLWIAMALDGVIAVVLYAFLRPARRAGRAWALQPAQAPVDDLTGAERFARGFLIAFAALFALGAVIYEIGPLLDTSEALFRELPFVTNSVVKVSMLAMLCGYAALDVKRNLELVAPIVTVHVVSVLASAVLLIWGDVDHSRPLFGGELVIRDVLWGAMALDGAIAVLFALTARAAWQARFGLRYFGPLEIRGLVGVADVIVAGEHEAIPADEVARNVDARIEALRARRRWFYRACLLAVQARPLLDLLPPLSELDPHGRRRYLERRFRRPPAWPPIVKHGTQVLVRVCQQLSYVGYYGDARTHASIGYEPFTQRDRYADLHVPEPGPHPLKVDRPSDVDDGDLQADICIVGSGAAGAILAHELAAEHPDANILVLERGRYLEPREFTEDEVAMIGDLYADGLMQQTEDWRFTILQGSCVGGSTTVNNAVCFDPPPEVLQTWNDAEHDAGLDLADLAHSVAAVRAWLPVERQTNAVLNPSGRLFAQGAAGKPLEAGVVEANIRDCFGSGYCNIGCRWGRKLSMLDTVLPWAQERFGERVRIVAECEVEQIVTRGGSPDGVEALRARLGDGRRVAVRAGTYILAAGAVASSYLLLHSGVGRGLPVGKRFSCNMGAPLTAEFAEPLRSYDGLQISHFGRPDPDRGFVFETWFNPPVSQALNMPGWFERHFENMRLYDHLMAVGVLVGTGSNGEVVRAALGGPGVRFVPEERDLATLADGLKLLGEILFDAGAKRVMVNTWGDDEFTDASQLGALDRIARDPDHITLGTGHPQGGNAMSRDPEKGVVGPGFRVHGFENLHVCDASVFPTSLTVNPQLTVMSLAHYAARRIHV